jgi:molybdopterin converting factor small subunit
MRVLLFAHLKDVARRPEVQLPGAPLDINGFWRALALLHPELETFRPSVRLERNGEYVGKDAVFAENDEVALIPPVSGG